MSKYKIASKKTSDLLFPDVRPTLDLNFVENQKVPPFVNVTRNSQTTYVDKFGILRTADINQPVFEWDPITGKCLGARIWGAVTNLCLRSEELTDATWITTSASSMSANTVIAPTGQLTADTLTVAGAVDFIYQIITVSPSTTYTGSVFVRLGTMPAANYLVAVYNQTAGSFIAADVVVAQTPTSSGWTRISYQFTTPSGCTSIRWYPFRNTSTITGQTVHLFGAQVNSGPLGPYVPTTTTASSTADVWTITGADFTRIVNQAEGTVYWSGSAALDSITRFGWVISSSGDYNNSHNFMRQSDGQFVLRTLVGGAPQYAVGWISSNPIIQAAYAYRQDDFAGLINGVALVSDASGSLPTTNRIDLGTLSGGNSLNGYIRRLTIYPKRLTNTQLQTLTR